MTAAKNPSVVQYYDGKQATFVLDPEYESFKPQQLKFDTLYAKGGEFSAIVLTWMFIAVTLLLMGIISQETITSLLGFTFDQVTALAVVEDCQVIDVRGQQRHRMTTTFQAGERRVIWYDYVDNCADAPIGNTYPVSYLPDDPYRFRRLDQPSAASNPLMLGCLTLLGGLTLLVTHALIEHSVLIWRALHAYPRLKADGEVLIGRISKIRRRDRRWGWHNVEVKYEFVDPDGKLRRRWQRQRRDDLECKPLPEVGTPVRVLYANRHAYVML